MWDTNTGKDVKGEISENWQGKVRRYYKKWKKEQDTEVLERLQLKDHAI